MSCPLHRTVRDQLQRALGMLALGHTADARDAMRFALDCIDDYAQPDAGAESGAVGESPDGIDPAEGCESQSEHGATPGAQVSASSPQRAASKNDHPGPAADNAGPAYTQARRGPGA